MRYQVYNVILYTSLVTIGSVFTTIISIAYQCFYMLITIAIWITSLVVSIILLANITKNTNTNCLFMVSFHLCSVSAIFLVTLYQMYVSGIMEQNNSTNHTGLLILLLFVPMTHAFGTFAGFYVLKLDKTSPTSLSQVLETIDS